MSDINRSASNRDYIKRLNYPRQTYAFTGIDYGDASVGKERIRNKLEINGAPMLITPIPPGAHGAGLWNQVYGASMDSIMSIFDGKTLVDSKTSVDEVFSPSNVFGRALFTASNSNIYDLVSTEDGSVQQIKYIVSGTGIDEARQTDLIDSLETVRSLCIRGPMHMNGWGRTASLLPTDPLSEDPRNNDDLHKIDRSTWLSGPVDLRWDELRQCWRGFNDLIADDYKQNLGTPVFSTNQDEACGFPFLRGKLEDVWVVRKVDPGAPNGKLDLDKSGTVCTKLSSLVFDEDPSFSNALVAPLSDVLKVYDSCNVLATATCGAEVTKTAELGIQTTARFYENDNIVGSILFNPNIPLDDPNFIPGEMYYLGDGPCGVWLPGVTIDICDIGSAEFDTVFNNDKNLQSSIVKTCKGLSFTQDNLFNTIELVEEIGANIENLSINSIAKGFGDIQVWSNLLSGKLGIDRKIITQRAFEVTINNIIDNILKEVQRSVQFSLDALTSEVNAALDNIVLQVKTICECDIDFVTPVVGSPIEINSISPLIAVSDVPTLDLVTEIELATEVGVNANSIEIRADLQNDWDHPEPVTTRVVDPCPPNTVSLDNTCQIILS